ncbi:LRR receptor serine/threonine-protein kinase [Salix suchowensis]|nr:LRR receptor serine/threonine-protein kinase [Salix suchowensis]
MGEEGSIPIEIGNLTSLRWLILYDNQLSGSIPNTVGKLKYLEVIRAGGNKNLEGKLRNLRNLLLWQNNLVGIIPPELGNCNQMLVIDISVNSLTGSIPQSFGNLTELQELQLSLNQISGEIPAQLGNCQKITHIELDNNQITGSIPPEIGYLFNLTLFYLWQNKLEGNIPPSISNCQNLEAIDFSQNGLVGPIPKGVFQLKKLNKLLLLSNNLSGEIPPEIGNCSFRSYSSPDWKSEESELFGSRIEPDYGSNPGRNLWLSKSRIFGFAFKCYSGNLPRSFNKLVSLQFVDFSNNLIEGTLSPSLGSLGSLTKLTLAKNRLSGTIPSQLGSCSKLQLLDLSGNQLSGNIPSSVGKIPSLEIALNLSLNQLNGEIPSEFTGLSKLGIWISPSSQCTFGNPALCFSGNQCDSDDKHVKRGAAARVAMIVLLCAACALLLAALFMILLSKTRGSGAQECDGEDDLEMSPPWEVTLYQKLDLSIADVARSLTAGNVIGQGRSGVVYKVTIPSELMVAVKRFNSAEKISAAAFSSEIATLARIRHRNIVRLLGWGANRKTKLLFYDYMANGTLGTLLHEGNTAGLVEWETRFKIALGVAEGLAYLHHDCVPPILHRDVKSHNILLGDRDHNGEKAVDPSFPDGHHVVQWVRDHLRCKKDPVEILDPKLQGHADTQIQEMLQALGISLLCTSNRAEDRPTMKDVAALLKEIRQELIPGGKSTYKIPKVDRKTNIFVFCKAVRSRPHALGRSHMQL